ncbi:MAG: hypothetical protein AAGA35_01690 [Patescibacteria group bacterium]
MSSILPGQVIIGVAILVLALALFFGDQNTGIFEKISDWKIWEDPIFLLISLIATLGFVGAHTTAGQGTELVKVARWVYRVSLGVLLLYSVTWFFESKKVEDPVKLTLEAVTACAQDRNQCPSINLFGTDQSNKTTNHVVSANRVPTLADYDRRVTIGADPVGFRIANSGGCVFAQKVSGGNIFAEALYLNETQRAAGKPNGFAYSSPDGAVINVNRHVHKGQTWRGTTC